MDVDGEPLAELSSLDSEPRVLVNPGRLEDGLEPFGILGRRRAGIFNRLELERMLGAGQSRFDLGHNTADVIPGFHVGKHVGHAGDVAVIDHGRPLDVGHDFCDVLQIDRRRALFGAFDGHVTQRVERIDVIFVILGAHENSGCRYAG